MKYVVEGAEINCSYGIGRSKIIKSDNEIVEYYNQAVVTIADNKPYINILPFPLCSSPMNPAVIANGMKPAKCNPKICLKWMNGKQDVHINGELALYNQCKLSCQYGGIIGIAHEGQY